MARGHDPVGELRAWYDQREWPLTGQPHPSPSYFVGVIRDDLTDVWTCEARKPAKDHQHLRNGLALDCAQTALSTGSWKDDLPPKPV